MTHEPMLAKAQKVLTARGARVAARQAYYDGRHDSQLGSKAWNDSFRRTVSGVIDNQCRLVVNTLADALVPVGVEPKAPGAYDEALAAWVSERFVDDAGTLATVLRTAETTGEQTTVAVDFDSEGEVAYYLLDPSSCYVQLDKAGGYLWAVHYWKADEDALTEATVYTPTETIHLASEAKRDLPAAQDFYVVDRTPNPFGEVMLATVDKRGSVIDTIKPLNDLLNKSLQTQMVTGEAYALPFRVYLGIEAYNPDTGETSGPALPSLNPATGGRDVSIPTVADAEGDKRQVLQFDSPLPSQYLAEQDAHRASIARLSNIPAFQLQVSGSAPVSGDALEIAFLPRLAQKQADERAYGPFLNRLARLSVRRRLYAMTGTPAPAPLLKTLFAPLNVSTTTTRTAEFSAAIAAGMTLEDALVEYMGMSRDGAALIAANAQAAAAERADRAAAMFDQGAIVPAA